MFTIGVFAIICDQDDRVLLCHRRDYDLWNMPGGRVESGESPWQAMIREVKEETGLDVEIINLTGVYSKPDKDDLVLSFVCEPIGGVITLNNEADEIKYFSLDDMPKNISPKQVERIKNYFNDKNKVYYKTQGGPSSVDLIKQGKL